MKPKTMILMVVAVACGLGASYMTSKLLADRGKGTEEPTVNVLVCKAKVAPWTAIKEPGNFFEEKPYPQSLVPKKALTSLDQLKDQRLNKAVDEGKPITEDDLLTATQIGLIGKMKPGERAIAIKVNAESLIGGFILPGYRVDVVCTMRGNDPHSKFILQDMLVLAVDAQTQRVEGQPHILASTVTFAAKPEEVTRLALATTMGDLRLTPRPLGDNVPLRNTISRAEDLGKPLHRSTSEREDDDRGWGGMVTLPKTSDLPPVDEKPEVEPKVAQDAPKSKLFVMRIRTPSTTTKVVFNPDDKDEDEEEGTTVGAVPPAARPAPTTPPVAPPARKDDKPEGKPEAKQPPGTGLRRTSGSR